MIKTQRNILVINPGTKYIGLAVFQGADLAYWAVKALRGKWSVGKIRRTEKLLRDNIERHGVNMLIIKRLHAPRSSNHLRCLVTAIGNIAKNEGLQVDRYELDDVKAYFGVNGASKTELARLVSIQYNFLADSFERELRRKHPYAIRMFEAIAAATYLSRPL